MRVVRAHATIQFLWRGYEAFELKVFQGRFGRRWRPAGRRLGAAHLHRRATQLERGAGCLHYFGELWHRLWLLATPVCEYQY